MKAIESVISSLEIRDPLLDGDLAVFPLFRPDPAAMDYLLLDEALDRDLAHVTEVSQAGSRARARLRERLAAARAPRRWRRAGGRPAEPHRQHLDPGGRGQEARHPRLVRGAGPVVVPQREVRRGEAIALRVGQGEEDGGRVAAPCGTRANAARTKARCGTTSARRSPTPRGLADLGHGGRLRGHRAGSRRLREVDRRAAGAGGARCSRAAIAGHRAGVLRFAGRIRASASRRSCGPMRWMRVEAPAPVDQAAALAEVRRFLDEMTKAATEKYAALGEGEDVRLEGENRPAGRSWMASGWCTWRLIGSRKPGDWRSGLAREACFAA